MDYMAQRMDDQIEGAQLEYIQMREEIESLRQQLAAMTKERDEIAAQARMLDRMVDERDDQLAAALAACEAKDAALESLISHTLSCEHRLDEFHGLGNDSGSGCSIELCNASSALTIKPDASALKAHDNELIGKVLARVEDVLCDAGLPRYTSKIHVEDFL